MTYSRPNPARTITRTRRARLALTALLVLVAGAYLAPIAWMLVTSLAPADAVSGQSDGVLPALADDAGGLRSPLQPSYWTALAGSARANYGEVWNGDTADFPLYFRNSLLIAILSVSGMVISSVVVAYGLSRLRWRGRDLCFALVLATMMIPFPVIMAPSYLLFRSFGWIGTFKPLWIPAWFGGAFSIFLLRQFFLTIPRSLDEAAMIDGCSRLGVLTRVILPLSRPALVVVALFHFIASWNDFVGPLIFLNHERMFTVSLGLFMYQSQHGGTPWNLVMAATMIVILPVLVLFLLAQRAFVEGIATQGVKG